MDKNTFNKGTFVISNQTIKINDDTTIILSKIDNLKTITFPKHSLFYGLKEWLIGFFVLLAICCVFDFLTIIWLMYILTIIPLFIFNISEYKKNYYGLLIQTNRKEYIFKSDNKKFIDKLHNTIIEAINNKENNIIINMDKYDINNGIINNGNNNINTIINKEDENDR